MTIVFVTPPQESRDVVAPWRARVREAPPNGPFDVSFVRAENNGTRAITSLVARRRSWNPSNIDDVRARVLMTCDNGRPVCRHPEFNTFPTRTTTAVQKCQRGYVITISYAATARLLILYAQNSSESALPSKYHRCFRSHKMLRIPYYIIILLFSRERLTAQISSRKKVAAVFRDTLLKIKNELLCNKLKNRRYYFLCTHFHSSLLFYVISGV